MSSANFLRLLVLAAIWGGSFFFMRLSAPVLGPAWLIEYRLLAAGVFLAVLGWLLKKRLDLRANWRHYLMLGFFNAGLPFLLFAYSARTLTASVMAVLNATAPLWGTLLHALWAHQPITLRRGAGLLLGSGGVALLVGFDDVTSKPGAGLAVAAVLVAALCYSIASLYARTAKSVDAFANAHGSMWAAALCVLPAIPFFPAPATPTIGVWGAVLALGVLCSGIAYLIYFRLIDEVGPTSALTVTFLSPMFGILWGALFLGEVVGWHTLAGVAIVLLGTALVTGFLPRRRAAAVGAAK